MTNPAHDALVYYTMRLERLELERKEAAARFRQDIKTTRDYIREAVRRLNGEDPQLPLPLPESDGDPA